MVSNGENSVSSGVFLQIEVLGQSWIDETHKHCIIQLWINVDCTLELLKWTIKCAIDF